MKAIEWSYISYIAITVPLVIWVARTLHKNGRVFLVDCFKGNNELADSVNHLLVVGFYLVNLGFVSLFLKTNSEVFDLRGGIELVSMKIGTVMLILGAMHFFNIYIFNKIRKREREVEVPPLPARGRDYTASKDYLTNLKDAKLD